MKPPSARVKDIARRIIGTPGMGEILDEVNELDMTDAKALDYLALRYEGCDWWFARREIVDDGMHYYCHECVKDNQ